MMRRQSPAHQRPRLLKTLTTFTPTGTDIDADTTLEYAIINTPTWATFNTATGTLSGTPTNDDIGITENIVDFMVPKHAGIFKRKFNDAPTITGTPPATIAEDTAYTFTATATDVDGDMLTYAITSKPTWANFNAATGTLSGTPTNTHIGTTTGIVISVSDGVLTASLTAFSITVTNVNDAPTITGTPETTVAQDAEYSFTPTGTDIDADTTLEYAIINTPTWATFETATGILSGTPTNTHIGTTTGIVISVSDGALTASLTAFSITATNVNDAPTITGTPTTTIAEDTDYTFIPGGGDVDGDTLTYSITNKPSWADFSTTTGVLSGRPTNDHIGITEDIVISVTDNIAEAVSLPTFSITVTNVNDAPTITGTPETTVAQNADYTFIPGGGDIDSDTLTYSIINKPSWAIFDTTTGALSGRPTNDHIGITEDIVISVTDNIAEAVSLPTFSITVTNVNDTPTITGTPTTTIAEDSVYTFTPSGGDVDGDTLTYSITNKPSWADFSTTTGALRGRPTNDHIGITENIVISVSDGTAGASLPTFSITVTNVNDAPTIIGTPETTVAQDTDYTFTPGGGDVDANDTLTYTITNTPTWATFETATGALSGRPTNVDVGTITTGIVITVSDGMLTASLPAFSLAVTNVNDAPTITGTPETTVAQDADYSFTPGGGDVDGNTLTYSITNKPTWATFNTTTGTLSGRPTNVDVGTTTTSIVITISDGTLTASLSRFSVTVTNVNDAPTITGTPTTTVAQDANYTFTPSGGDVDANDTLTYTITNTPTWVTFDTATGTLSGRPTNVDVGTTTTSIVITISDGTLTASLSRFSVTVTNVNDAPTITGTPTTTVAQDADYTFTPSGGDVDANDTLTYTITNTPTWATFDTATGTLSGIPTNAHIGITEDIVISVTDNIAEAVSLPTFSITVTNVNDAPTITGTPTTIITEDTDYTFTPSGGDVDGDTLTYSITNKPSWADFSTTTGALSGRPTNDHIGITEYIVISVSDGTLTASLSTFSVTVTNVNDTPTITGTPTTTIAEDTDYTFIPGGGDVDGDTLTYSITNKPTWATLDTATGTLSGTPTNAHIGITTGIVISVSDGIATASLTAFALAVTNVNDAPTITGTPTTIIAEGTTYTFIPGGGDIDSDTLTYSINNKPTWATLDTATGTLSGTPTNAHIGITTDIVISVSDGTLTASLPTFSITVTNVNDTPTITGTPTTIIAEDTAYTFIPGGGDIDSDTLTYSITNTPTWADFSTTTGALSGRPTNDHIGITEDIVISVSDGTLSASLSAFSIAVTNVNDAPTITGTPETTVAQDADYSFTPGGGDVDGDTLTYSTTNTPTWSTFETATGRLTGTPTNADIGTTTGIVISVSDGTLTASLPTFSITVTNVNDAPTITGTPETTVAQGAEYSFIPGGGDVDGDTLAYSITNTPTWATFNTTTGTLSGRPTNVDVGTTTTGIVISVSDGTLTASLPTFSITVTNVNDTPTITGTPETTVAQDADYSFTPTGTDIDADTTLEYTIINTPTWATFETATGRLTGTPTNDDIGITEDIVISVTDNIAEAVSLSTFSITVTNTNDAPTITGTPETTVAQGAEYSFTPIGTDIDADTTLEYAITSKPSWADFSTTTGTLSGRPTNVDVGTTTTSIVISVSDGTLTASLPTFSITVTNVNDTPTITGTPTTIIAEDTDYTFIPGGGDVDGDTLTYSIINKPTWATLDTATGTLSGTPTNAHIGIITGIVISVSDGIATASLTAFALAVTNVNDSGTLTITGTARAGQTLTANVTDADGTDGVMITYQWQVGTDDIAGAMSKTYTLTQAEVGQRIKVTARYTDEHNTAEDLISAATAVVTNVDVMVPKHAGIFKRKFNDAPTITGTPPATIAEDTAYTFTATATDVDGDMLTYAITSKPTWANFNAATGTLSGTPTNTHIGTTTGIVISVSDGALTASLTAFSITVTNVNDAPTITGTPETTVAQDADYSFTPTGTDIDADTTLEYAITSKPTWANFNTATGTLSGTPTNTHIGTTTGIVISVSDGVLTASLPTFSITVTNVNDTPTITGTPETTVAQGAEYSFTPTGTDIDADTTLEYAITNTPTWATFNTATGTLSGRPTNAHIGITEDIVISVFDGKAKASLPAFSITVTVNAITNKKRIKQLNKAIMPRLAQTIIANSAVSVEHRVDTEFSNAPRITSYQLDGSSVQLDGESALDSMQNTVEQKLPTYIKALKDETLDWKRMLGNSSFVMSLDSGDDTGFGATVWGSGEYTGLDSKSDAPDVPDWRGEVISVQLGVDKRVHDDLLVGGLVSWSEGDVDYTLAGERGKHTHQVTSVHPYLAWSHGDVKLWGSAGYGRGNLAIEENDVISTTDTDLLSLLVGVKKPLSPASGVSIKSDIALIHTRINESTRIAEQDIASQRLRLLLEVEREYYLATSVFNQVAGIGLRYDGGAGDTGVGVELSMTMHYDNPIMGLAAWSQARALLGRDDYKEWGVQGVISLGSGADEHGLSFKLSPSYGNTGSRMGEIWRQGLLDKDSDDSGGNQDDGARMEAYLGYGLSAPNGRGLLLPYAEMTLGDSRSYRLGLRWKRSTRFDVNIVGERSEGSTVNHKVLLESRIRL